jgi:8-oxo-dGTP pyrophosphatase MutT (NUDIX family)
MAVERWKLLEKDYIFNRRWLKIQTRRYYLPTRRREADFYLFEYSPWVSILPITPSGDIILIRQYRPGLDRILWEIPAGLVDAGEKPLDAARRELLEETGYSSDTWELLGAFSPNPGTHTNLSYSYIARNVLPAGSQELDETEEIDVVLKGPGEVRRLLKKGEFAASLHALHLLLYFFRDAL